MADVFTVLSQDHEEVKRMLAELETGRPGSPRQARTSWRCARRSRDAVPGAATDPARPRRPWGAGTGRLRAPRPVRQKDWIIPNGPWCYGPGPATVRR